jgi:hypothetical protein
MAVYLSCVSVRTHKAKGSRQLRRTPQVSMRLVPGEGFEPPAFGLQNRCTTTVLTRQLNGGADRRGLLTRRRPVFKSAMRSVAAASAAARRAADDGARLCASGGDTYLFIRAAPARMAAPLLIGWPW